VLFGLSVQWNTVFHIDCICITCELWPPVFANKWWWWWWWRRRWQSDRVTLKVWSHYKKETSVGWYDMNGKKAVADIAKYNFVPLDEIKSERCSSVLDKSSFLFAHCICSRASRTPGGRSHARSSIASLNALNYVSQWKHSATLSELSAPLCKSPAAIQSKGTKKIFDVTFQASALHTLCWAWLAIDQSSQLHERRKSRAICSDRYEKTLVSDPMASLYGAPIELWHILERLRCCVENLYSPYDRKEEAQLLLREPIVLRTTHYFIITLITKLSNVRSNVNKIISWSKSEI